MVVLYFVSIFFAFIYKYSNILILLFVHILKCQYALSDCIMEFCHS